MVGSQQFDGVFEIERRPEDPGTIPDCKAAFQACAVKSGARDDLYLDFHEKSGTGPVWVSARSPNGENPIWEMSHAVSDYAVVMRGDSDCNDMEMFVSGRRRWRPTRASRAAVCEQNVIENCREGPILDG